MLMKRIGVIMYQTSKSKGQELVAQRMVREFIKLGHEAYLITSIYHDDVKVLPPRSLGKGKGYVYIEDSGLGIPIIRVDSYVTRWPPRRIAFRDFIHTLERIVDEFGLNVLITHSTLWNGPEDVVKFVAWRRDIRNLGGYHDPIVFCHMSHFQEPSPKRYSLLERSFRVAWNRTTLPQIFKMTNLILVVTPFEMETKVKMGAKRSKCFLFPGGVDEENFLRHGNVDIGEFLKQLNIKKGARIVSYLGSLEERKNPMAVLKVAERLRERSDVHFVVAGRDDLSYAERVKKIVRSLPNVTYLGEIDDREKVLLIKASYLNILMSRLEALGLAQLEFMYFGVPVITSAVGGQAWLVQNRQEGIHIQGPDDIEGAANAIKELVDNPDIWGRLSVNAKEKARDLTISRLTTELDATLTEELMKESGLTKIPMDVRSTLAEPECVLRSWSSGSWAVVATNRRLFLRSGVFSRKVTEIPYANITSIEHMRRYAWKTLVLGFAFSYFLLVEPFLGPIFSRVFISKIEALIRLLLSGVALKFAPPEALQNILPLIPLLPLLVSAVVFAAQARVGFALHGQGIKPLYLPYKFHEAITFIRSIQDKQLITKERKPVIEGSCPST